MAKSKLPVLQPKEILYIYRNLKKSDKEIAFYLGVDDEDTIYRYRIKIEAGDYDEVVKKIREGDITDKIVNDMKAAPDWANLERQFTPEEITFYQARYIQLVAQFQNDVLVTENIQLSQAITFEILMARIMADTQIQTNTRADLNDIYLDLKARGLREKDEDKSRELKVLMLDVQAKIAGIDANIKDNSKEYRELQTKHGKLLSDLKATRNQRLEKIEKAGESFLDLCKHLDDRENQLRESRNLELIRKAAEVEKARMMENHEFADNTVHPILMTPENPNIG